MRAKNYLDLDVPKVSHREHSVFAQRGIAANVPPFILTIVGRATKR